MVYRQNGIGQNIERYGQNGTILYFVYTLILFTVYTRVQVDSSISRSVLFGGK